MQAASTSTRLLILVVAAVTLAFAGAIAGGHAIAAGWRLDPSYPIAVGEVPLVTRLSYTGGYRYIAHEQAVARVEPAPTRRQPEMASLPAAHAVATEPTLPKAQQAVAVVGAPREVEPPTRVIIIEPPTASAESPASPADEAMPVTDATPSVAARSEPDATPHRSTSLPAPPPTAMDDAAGERAPIDDAAPAATMKPAERAAPVTPGMVETSASKPPVSSDAPEATKAAPPSPAAALDDDDEADQDAAEAQPTPKRVIKPIKRHAAPPKPVVRKARVAKASGDTSASPSQAPRWARGAFTPD